MASSSGSFNVSFRLAKCQGVSHAWIALHRCVEANARLTGESFPSIFARLEKDHGFSRTKKEKWPDLAQVHASADQLQRERIAWKQELRALIDQRRAEKMKGKRQVSNPRLLEMMEQQKRYVHRSLGYWGWRKIREQEREK